MQVENDELEREARSISRKFKKAFRLFRACHDLYSLSRKMTEDEIDELGNVTAWSCECKWRYFVYRNRDPTLPDLLSRELSGILCDPKDALLGRPRRSLDSSLDGWSVFSRGAGCGVNTCKI